MRTLTAITKRATLHLSVVAALGFIGVLSAAAQSGTPVGVPSQPPSTPKFRDPALRFLAPYGIANFQPQAIRALQVFLGAKEKYESGEYLAAEALLDDLWAEYPAGSTSWGALPTKPFGINIGSPPCYYGLRMLSQMTEFRVHGSQPAAGLEKRVVQMTILLAGQSSGIEPQNTADLWMGTGIQVTHDLDPRIAANDACRVRRALAFFQEYVFAATNGLLEVELNILPLPSVNLAVKAEAPRFAGLTGSSEVFASVPQATIDATDWWWLIYPSHVPEQYPVFQNREFITGGMGSGPGSVSPLFIVDDRWLLRKPPHIGTGEYSSVEFNAYLPQWLQHEFFHHLFRTYPEFGLETSSHQWFNLSTWPQDFTGRYEADYYHEALTKRLQGATPALHSGLRYATDEAPFDQITIGQLTGTYERTPVQNPWHIGDIEFGPQLRWRNTANVRWNLAEDIDNGSLLTGPDCPYFNSPGGDAFSIVLERDLNGDFTPVVRGFAFNGELYERQ